MSLPTIPQSIMKTFNDILSLLTNDEKQLLADTILKGGWGDCEMEFVNEDGETETAWCYGYCTNDAHKAGHFSGRKLSAMFRSLYKKVETKRFSSQSGAGEIICHCNDWWGDGSGDMLFIRDPFDNEANEWARNYKPEAEEPAKEEAPQETMFDKILKGMSVDDKAEVMRCLCKVESLFRENSGAKTDEEWFSIMSGDEALKNFWIGTNIASRVWFKADKGREQANQ